MYTILGKSVILIVEHLTMEQVGTFMSQNHDKIGTVTIIDEITGERRDY